MAPHATKPYSLVPLFSVTLRPVVSTSRLGNARALPPLRDVIRLLHGWLGIAVLLLATLPLCAASPLNWRWSNPLPFGSDIFDMCYGLGLTVAVTERGGIFTSEDLDLWEPRVSHTTNALRAVTFFGDRLVIT